MSDERAKQLEQIKKRVMDGGLVISAGAGTGKTHTLIESYQAAVEKIRKKGLPRVYDQILAITFTNAATYEFKKRIQGKVANDKAEIESYLTSQEISTIHSACQRMLQNLALDVGLNPSTEVYEEADDINLASEVLDTIIRESLAKGDADVIDLLSRYDLRGYQYQDGLRDFLFTFHSKARTLGWSIDEALKKCRDALDTFEKSLAIPPTDLAKWMVRESFISNEADSGFASQVLKEVIKVSRRFLKLYEAYAREFDKTKRNQGLVSHDDSLYYANDALEKLPHKDLIRDFYLDKYKMVLVDEYQDTDPLQDKIIEKISHPDRIYRVGDVKQSIFRFRRAAPWIFQDRVRKSDRAKKEIESLTGNRRSRAELVNFTNYLFSKIFTSEFLDGNGLGGVPFEALEAVRDPAEGEEDLNKQVPIEVYKIGEGRIGPMCDDEANFVAKRILRLVGSYTVYRKGEGDGKSTTGPCEFKDIAILLRTKTHLERYLGALRQNGIPYVMADAPGFFDSPEIGLVLDYLRSLNDPNDHLIRASLLRSAVFCLSDSALFKLAKNSYKINEEFISTVDQESDKAKLRRFWEIDRELQNEKSLPKRDLIEEILKRTDMDLVYLSKVNGSQAYANVMKLLDMTSSFDKDVNGSLDAFLNWIDGLEETTDQTQAQVYDDASNAVKVFTIHKSKGLEFPVVFVPMLFRWFREFPVTLYIDKDSSLNLPSEGQTKIPFLMKPGDTGLAGPRPGLADMIIEELFDKVVGTEFLEDVYEEWRLLYVAFTRARDLLIFSLCQDAASVTIKKYTTSAGVDLHEIAKKDWNTRVAMLVAPPPSPAPQESVARITWHDVVPQVARPELTPRKKEIGPTKAIEEKQALPRLSATDFADYEYCPRRYYYSKVLGLRQYERHTGEEEEDRSSQEMGIKLHEMLEAYDFGEGSLPKTPRLTEKERAKLMPLVEAVGRSALGKKIAGTSQEGQRREFEFSTNVEGVQFVSRIDLALRNNGTDWNVYDYKSGKRTEMSLELYKKQVSFYARLFEHALGASVKNCAIVYADLPEPDIVSFEPVVTMDQIKGVVAEIEKNNFDPKGGPEKCKACPYSGSKIPGRSRWVCKIGFDHGLASEKP